MSSSPSLGDCGDVTLGPANRHYQVALVLQRRNRVCLEFLIRIRENADSHLDFDLLPMIYPQYDGVEAELVLQRLRQLGDDDSERVQSIFSSMAVERSDDGVVPLDEKSAQEMYVHVTELIRTERNVVALMCHFLMHDRIHFPMLHRHRDRTRRDSTLDLYIAARYLGRAIRTRGLYCIMENTFSSGLFEHPLGLESVFTVFDELSMDEDGRISEDSIPTLIDRHISKLENIKRKIKKRPLVRNTGRLHRMWWHVKKTLAIEQELIQYLCSRLQSPRHLQPGLGLDSQMIQFLALMTDAETTMRIHKGLQRCQVARVW